MVTPLTERAGHWVLDGGRSSVAFGQKAMWGLVPVKGVFSTVSGSAEIGTDGTVNGVIEVEAASVNSKNKKRDTHLRSADFVDVEKHASITYRLTGVVPVEADGTVALEGELEVAGTRRPLALVADVTEAGADEVTVSAIVPVTRADYGLTWNKMGVMRGVTKMTIRAVFPRA